MREVGLRCPPDSRTRFPYSGWDKYFADLPTFDIRQTDTGFFIRGACRF